MSTDFHDDARMLQPAGCGSWSADEISAVWSALTDRDPDGAPDDVEALELILAAQALRLTPAELLARIPSTPKVAG